jgi:formylglycine-generating enzyme required for sulfatase activity
MQTPLAFFKFITKAVLNAVGFGLAGDFAVEVVPDVARDVWRRWAGGKPPEQLQAEVQAVAALSDAEARRQAEQAVTEEAADQPEAIQLKLITYLAGVPATIRRSQRRPADPDGRTVRSCLRQPADLLPLLPVRLPRFAAGDRPAGIGDWELEELLGAGGFGEVWKARNPHLAEPVALKFCLDEQAARVLRNEAALLARVMSQGRHPGIVQLRHTYLSADPPCLEYEYVPGGDLAGLIAAWQQGTVPARPEQAARLLQALAGIVGFLHRLDPPVVHRDLKPANILLQPTGRATVSLRVTDLGIGGLAAGQALVSGWGTRTAEPSLGRALRGAHTPLYASPQQQRGEAPDPRDDVHALGVIWYQLLTGDLALLSLPPDWRDELAERGVAEPMLRLLGACLSARAERRPADAAVLAEEIGRLLQGRGDEPRGSPLPGERRALRPPSSRPPSPRSDTDTPLPQRSLADQVQQALRLSERAHARARRRAELEHDYAGAVALLEEVPLPLRDAELYVRLCQRRDRVEQLEQRVRAAVAEGRFGTLRSQVEELLQLVPQRQDLRRLLESLPQATVLERGFRPGDPAGTVIENTLEMLLVRLPLGTFRMGSPLWEPGRDRDEGPQREVTIAEPFYLATVPVTQCQYEQVMGRNPAHFTQRRGGGPDHPVESVSWEDAWTFCEQLSALPKERQAGRIYRLPTEAEWEYACRAGSSTPFACGTVLSSLQANFDGTESDGCSRRGSCPGCTTPVESYPPNAFGLFDVHGNVWEWCADWYAPGYDAGGVAGPRRGSGRVRRGGSWANPARRCRSAARGQGQPAERCDRVGFRVALTVASWAR